MNGGLRLCLLWAAVLSPATAIAAWSSAPDFRVSRDLSGLFLLEQRLDHTSVHASEFSPLSAPLALPRCGMLRPPEALLTPDPLLQLVDDDLRVRVSFIVGADGRVHSAFILDSAGPEQDEVVLNTVRRWRYRPALCNGVPTDSEARVIFSNGELDNPKSRNSSQR